MDIKLIAINMPATPKGYGINFSDSTPVSVEGIVPNSVAEIGGLKYGDFLMELNGNDIQSFTKEAVISSIKSNNMKPLKLRVGRVKPIPMTAEDKKKAAKMLQNKLATGEDKSSEEIQSYRQTVKASLLEVEDLLGSFDLPPLIKPTKTTSTKDSAITSKGEVVTQEVEMSLYDSDTLPSPPSSNSSSVGDSKEEMDRLLDFSHDDEFNYDPGSPRVDYDPTLAGLEAPRIMKAMFEAQHGIEGLKDIIHGVREKKKNQKPSEEVVATFTPTQRIKDNGTSIGSPQQSDRKSQDSPSYFNFPPPPSSPNAKANVPLPDLTQTTPISKTVSSPVKTVLSPVKTIPLARATPGGRPLARSPKSPSTKQPHPFSPSRQSEKEASNTFLPPEEQQWNYPSSSPQKVNGTVPLSRDSGHNQENDNYSRLSWEKAESSKFKGHVDRESSKVKHTTPSQANPVSTADQLQKMSHHGTVSPPPPISPYNPAQPDNFLLSNKEGTNSPPPPIPPYNPTQPDDFLLSNKEEYRREYKKQMHSYEQVQAEEVKRVHGNMTSESSDVTPPTSPLDGKMGVSKLAMEVPLRRKKRKPGDSVPRIGSGEGRGEKDSKPDTVKIQSREESEMEIRDLANVELACNGLPISVYEWKHEEIYQWLLQLSPSLYKLYKSNFVDHDIIGRSLLRLNVNKIKNMGISSIKHSRILAMEITRLKVRQEKMELEELREDIQLSYL